MTFEEAKKILEKEGFDVEKATRPCAISEAFTEYEDPTICEAMQVISSAGYFISMEISRFDERKARLKKEHEKHANASDKMGMTLKEAKDILKKEFAVIDLHKSTEPFEFDESRWIEHEKPSVLEAFRVLAKEGYYISISGHDYNMREKCLQKEYEQNTKASGHGEEQSEEKKGIIYPSTSPKADFYYKHVLNEGNPALKEAASQFNDALLDEQAKKIARLKKIIRKKNMKIEEFRKESSIQLRGKIKMFVENRDLEGKLKDKDAVLSDVAEELRLSKIREKNLAELGLKYVGENEKLKKELADKVVDKIDAQALKSAESALAEKDEVIADLGNELAEIKKRVEWVRNASKEYCDYGVAANEFIKELAGLYVIANNKGIINDEMLERCKNYQTYGFPANCNRETKKEINDIARGNENKKPSLFRDDSVGAVTNQKDCSPVKDTHPTEDKPEEVELDEILECVRKALEKGHTVSIDYDKAEEGGDQSATIVQCDNGIILSKEEAEIIERCTKNGTELHYSEKDGLTYTNMYGEEMPIRCLRGMFHVFTDEEIENMKK